MNTVTVSIQQASDSEKFKFNVKRDTALSRILQSRNILRRSRKLDSFRSSCSYLLLSLARNYEVPFTVCRARERRLKENEDSHVWPASLASCARGSSSSSSWGEFARASDIVNVHVVKSFDNTLHLPPPLDGTKLDSKMVGTTGQDPSGLCRYEELVERIPVRFVRQASCWFFNQTSVGS